MTAHVGERIQFETRQGPLQGRIARALGGADFVVQVEGQADRYVVRQVGERFMIPCLAELAAARGESLS